MAFDISSIFKDVPESGTGREQIEYIKLDLIDDDKKNFYSTDEIESLSRNIATIGLLDPLRVRDHTEAEGRYEVVSGHRRRLALKLLAQDDPAQWGEVACIHEKPAISPAFQQLRLIFANADNRKMSDADISEQAVQVERLLYQLKEEEGYEFPGRMRDHVAEIVHASKSKLARLKVIRENLAECWNPKWKAHNLNESVAYELAQMSTDQQSIIYRSRGDSGYLDAKYTKIFRERFAKIDQLKCKKFPDRESCHNAERKKTCVAAASPYGSFYCDKCCNKCPDLASCKYVCPSLASKAAKLCADKRAARKQELSAEREAERPKTEQVESIWRRFGAERNAAGCTVKDVKDVMGLYYYSDEQARYEKTENGTTKVSPGSKLPFGNYLHDVSSLIAIADRFKCSVDYLLCRTDVKEMAQAGESVPESGTGEAEPEFISGNWYAADKVEPPVGVNLILIDSGGYVDTGKYKGCGEYTMDFGDPVVLWTFAPEEKDVSTAPPVVSGWQTGKPWNLGQYAVIVRWSAGCKRSVEKMEWDGENWRQFSEVVEIFADTEIFGWIELPEEE